MFFEFLNAVVTLDFDWLVWIVFANFHYLFAFFAMIFFFFNGRVKAAIPGFLFFSIMAWAFFDFSTTSGWLFFIGGFLMLHYTLKIAVLSFSEADPKLSKYLLIINFLSGYILLVVYNLFMVG